MSFLEHLSVETHRYFFQKVLAFGWIKGVGGSMLAVYATLFNDHKVLVAVFTLICIDTLLGFLAACKLREVSSSSFFRVLIKALVYSLMMMTGRLVDQVLPIEFSSSIIESFLVMTEALSILENSAKLGVPVPMKLVHLLKQVGDHKENLLQKKKPRD